MLLSYITNLSDRISPTVTRER